MDLSQHQNLDSPSKNSYVGSFYLPPEKLHPSICASQHRDLPQVSSQWSQPTPENSSRAVLAALRTLQEKMRRLELERFQAEKDMKQFSLETGEGVTEKTEAHNQEMLSQLRSAEVRCALLEKQLNYMRRMVEKAEEDRNAIVQKQVALRESREVHTKLQKLEVLQKECEKLTSTQSLAEKKIELLERKLLEEERERKLVQEKAKELQKALEMDAAIINAASTEVKPKKKQRGAAVRSVVTRSPLVPKVRQLPFVAGMSTSPSHSVAANMQRILHMMKNQKLHPWTDGPSDTRGPRRARSRPPHQVSQAKDGLSELLLTLQDELGRMSFEHQELVKQVEETKRQGLKDDLERELESLVKRMENKGTQIIQLRKHQEAQVQKLQQRPSSSRPPRRRAVSADGRACRTMNLPHLATPIRRVRRKQENPKRSQTHLGKHDIRWEA